MPNYFEEKEHVSPISTSEEIVKDTHPEPVVEKPIIHKIQKYRICVRTKLTVYANPTKDSKIVGKLDHGAIVESLDEKDGWIKVKLGKGEGWIPKTRTVEV